MPNHLSPVHTGDKVEFNMVDFVESPLLPKLATKSTYTFNFVAGSVDFLASVYGASVDFLASVYGASVDFLASVYGAKATQSTPVLNSTLSPVCTRL